ncbi:AAA family ATPase [Dyadobacter jiangsuensis]
MLVRLQTTYRSLSPISECNLDGLVILTGKNGSGKTHFLEALATNGSGAEIKDLETGSWVSAAPYVSFEGINVATFLENANLRRTYSSDRIDPEPFDEQVLSLLKYLSTDGRLTKFLDSTREELLSQDEEYLDLIRAFNRQRPELYMTPEYDGKPPVSRDIEKEIIEFHGLGKIGSVESLIESLEAKKRWHDLAKQIYPDLTLSPEPYELQLHQVIYNYLDQRHDNAYSFFRKKEFGEVNESVSDAEFSQNFPAPWDTINKISGEYGLDFELPQQSIAGHNKGTNPPLIIRHRRLKTDLGFDQISSGEKQILGLILLLFLNEAYNKNLKYPKIMLLDEPDAYLHPESCALMLQILHKTFVKDLGITIILTTHSPTTVALAPDPDASLFEINSGPHTYLRPTSKDAALTLLTGFLPTLSIDYKNHRQVFVEGDNDRMYYQGLFDIYNQAFPGKLRRKLYFIAGGNGRSNKDEVIGIVTHLRESGNRTSYGVIDWDKGNCETEFTFVHGDQERYSLENFIFDPIYCIMMLLSESKENIHDALGLPVTYPEQSIGEESDATLQRFVNYFFERIRQANPIPYKTLGELKVVQYLNGRQLLIPEKYLFDNGHTETLPYLNKAFPFFRDDARLKEQLITKILRCYPFIPLPSIQILERLANC